MPAASTHSLWLRRRNSWRRSPSRRGRLTGWSKAASSNQGKDNGSQHERDLRHREAQREELLDAHRRRVREHPRRQLEPALRLPPDQQQHHGSAPPPEAGRRGGRRRRQRVVALPRGPGTPGSLFFFFFFFPDADDYAESPLGTAPETA